MNFEIEDTNLPEVKIIKGKRFHDERGFFSETYKVSEFAELGLPTFVQDNMSESKKGVIRGLHWQDEPYGQGKLVQCVSGSILDVAVDIRKDSPNFGKYVAIELSANVLKLLWVPIGFAHGFQSLENESLVTYKVTNYWNKESEKSLNPLDTYLNLPWEKTTNPILSSKDNLAPNLSEI